MILSVLAFMLAANGRAYVWNVETPGRTVAFGVPDTDDRALRIDCERNKGRKSLSISGPVDADFGAKVVVEIFTPNGSVRLRGDVSEAGDGADFSVPASPDVLQTLMAGKPITISVKGAHWTVPGRGAARILGPLMKICAGR